MHPDLPLDVGERSGVDWRLNDIPSGGIGDGDLCVPLAVREDSGLAENDT